MCAEVYQQLKSTLKAQGLATGVGDEGGFAPALTPTRSRWSCSSRPSRPPATEPGEDVAISLDPAASEFFVDGRYELTGEGRSLSSQEMVDYWETVNGRYPLLFAGGRDGRAGLGRVEGR